MNKRQLGRFSIAVDEIDRNPAEIARVILAGLVVVRAEMMYQGPVIEYIAIGPDFRLVDDGEIIPRYVAILRYDGLGGCKRESWQEVKELF